MSHSRSPDGESRDQDSHMPRSNGKSERPALGSGKFHGNTSRHLIQKIQTGAPAERLWEVLHQRYHLRTILFARLQLGPRLRKIYSAEDLVQEAWLRVYCTFSEFDYRGHDTFYRWICQNIRWVASSWGRQGRPEAISQPVSDAQGLCLVEEVASEKPGPRTEVGGQDVVNQLHKSLDALPPHYQEILIAVPIEGISREEYAQDRGLKIETVHRQVSRGLEKWRLTLGGIDPTEYLK